MATTLLPSTEENHLSFLENIHPAIETFAKDLTEEQWRAFLAGMPDDFTKILLAKLILDIVTCVSKKFKSSKMVLTEENVQNMLGNTLPQMFADALNVEGDVGSAASQHLNKLLSQEVTDVLSCDASGSPSHMTPPRRLNTIVLQTFKMLKTFVGKVKKIKFLEKKKLANLDKGERFEALLFEYLAAKYGGPTAAAEATIRSSLIVELRHILTPFLQAIPEDQVKVVLSETSHELEVLINDLTDGKHNKLPVHRAMVRVKTFFTKCFAKAIIHKTVAELKTNFPKMSSVENKKMLQLLAKNVDSLLKSLEVDKEDQGFHLVTRAEKSRFTEALINVICSHVIPESERKAEAHIPPSPHCSDVDAAVREKVKKVLVLLGWWSNIQVNSCCDRMLLTLNRFRSRPEKDTREDTDELENSDIQSDYFEDADVESNDLEDSGSKVKYFDNVVVKFENLEEEDVETFDFTHSSQSNIPKDSDVQLDNDNLLHDYFNNDEATLSSVDTAKDENNQADHQEDADTDSNDSGDADVKSTCLEDADAESNDFEDADVKSTCLEDADADAESSDFEDADVKSTCLEDADADAESSDFEDADIKSTCLKDADAESSDFEDADIKSTCLEDADADAESNDFEDADVTSDEPEDAAVLSDHFENEEGMLVGMEKPQTFVYLFIELLVWELVKQAKIVGNDMGTVIQRLSEATWANLEGADSSLLQPHRLKGLKKKVCKKLCKEFGCAEDLLLHLSLNDEAVQDCTAAIIASLLKTQKKPSMGTKFVSWLKRVFTGCCG